MAEETPPPRKKRRKRSKKFKALILVVVLAAIGGLVYFNLKKEKPPETFATMPVERGNVVDKLAETGTIELVRTVEVKSTVAGKIRRLLVEAGDWVEKDQLLAVIEPDPAQSLQLYQTRSRVDQARLSLRDLETNFERTQSLYKSAMIAPTDYENAQMRLTAARNDLRLAELELEVLETKANLTKTVGQGNPLEQDEVRVLAPITGIAIRRGVEVGEVVASGISSYTGGTVLFELGDPSQMIVRADIAEVDIGKLKVGQVVDIVADAYPDTTYRGRARWIAPVGQKKSGSTIVTFDTEIEVLDHDPKLRQGMSCDLDIVFSRRDSTLFLPSEGVLELFEGEEKEQEKVKGKRGRFLAYVVRPAKADSAAKTDTVVAAGVDVDSSAAVDSAAVATADSARTAADSARADSAKVAKKPEPPKVELDRFAEVELKTGLETSTRVEILSGLGPADLVAADPQLIRKKLEEKAKAPPVAKKKWGMF